MSKLKRDARAFAARVKMGTNRLWLIVEGRVHDRPFYDRLLATHPGLDGAYAVRLAESVEVHGVSTGGKAFALNLYRFLDEAGLLTQRNNGGSRLIAIALDRDLDHISGELVTSPHVIYTATMDVESEILLHGDLQAAAVDAYSLTRELVAPVISNGRDLASDLAQRWHDWITIGASASCCGVQTDVPYAQRSRINVGGYGEVNVEEAAQFAEQIAARVASDPAKGQFEAARAQVEALFERGEQWTLIKGKWLAGYVWHLLGVAMGDEPRETNVVTETLAKACLPSLNFELSWANHYRTRFEALLAA